MFAFISHCIFCYLIDLSCKFRQKQLEEERDRKILALQEAKERQKRDKQENKIRRVQLDESCRYFNGN